MRVQKPKVVEKPWGREIWLAHEGEYAGKILEVKKGSRLSLQYHKRKKETMYILEGEIILILNDKKNEMRVGDSITINPGDKHRVEALDDTKIIEVSTPELDDVVRLKDDYGRK